jgi:hypothetical protein
VKPRCVGIIGSGFDGDMGLAMMAVLGLISHSKPRAPRHLTPEEIAAHDKRTERERWNERPAMSADKNINRWHEAITPRNKAPLPWTIKSGGSWDMLEVQPISDEMLSELARRYYSAGAPWNCRSMPLSDSDREYMFMLYYAFQGMVARLRVAEAELAARPAVVSEGQAVAWFVPHDLELYLGTLKAFGSINIRLFSEAAPGRAPIYLPATAAPAPEASSVIDMELALYRDAYGSKVPSEAMIDVLAERRRQIDMEGWTTAHDDAYSKNELQRAAMCYLMLPASDASLPHALWPWDFKWWRPTTYRRNLVKAGALILAEIERIDRATPATEQAQTNSGEGAGS